MAPESVELFGLEAAAVGGYIVVRYSPEVKGEEERLSTVSRVDYQLLASFRYALRQFLHFSEQASRAAGLPPRQHQALLAIAGSADGEHITVGMLAEQLLIKHQSAVGLVDRMQKRGLVVRRRDHRDRRHVFLGLTRAGERVLKKLAVIHKTEIARISPTLQEILGNLRADG